MKINETKFFYKYKKPYFWSISSNNPALSRTISLRFVAPCLKLEKKLMIQFQQNAWTDASTEERTERRKDGQIIFYRTLRATTGGPKLKQTGLNK